MMLLLLLLLQLMMMILLLLLLLLFFLLLLNNDNKTIYIFNMFQCLRTLTYQQRDNHLYSFGTSNVFSYIFKMLTEELERPKDGHISMLATRGVFVRK